MPTGPFQGRAIMSSSLKAYAPLLAWRLGTTPAALYERQRALVREGILEQSEGHGPGSGVPLSHYSVALLLVAVLVTDSLSETADEVRIFATAKSIEADGVCSLTRKRTFVEAIALILDSAHEHWRKLISITMHRTRAAAVINYEGDNGSMRSRFAAELEVDTKRKAATKLLVDATLTRDLMLAITIDLKKMAESQQRVRSAALQRTADSEQRIEPRGRRTPRAKKRRSKGK
jgi:hypothetical protein